MRTNEEILQKLMEFESEGDFFGHQRGRLFPYLESFEDARPWLADEVTREQWAERCPQARDHESIVAQIRDYLPFAWEKATGHRGLSAGRSISHMRAWLWMLGDEELLKFAEDGKNYAQYGAPILLAICRRYEIEVPEREDVIRMSQGLPCRAGCSEGCGR